MLIKVLAVGDVVGAPGVAMLSNHLRQLKKIKGIDFTVVNGENADGVGVRTVDVYNILDAGADAITLGNHTWTRREIRETLEDEPRLIRPANFAPQVPGSGWTEFDMGEYRITVFSLIGRCGMDFNSDNPFRLIDGALKDKEGVLLVDFHAEATSEKLAMAHFLDGRASVLWGTHTHVQTSDDTVFPKGLGYITDLGMTGPANSVLGIRPELSISRFLGNPPERYVPAAGPCKLEGAIFTIDTADGKCRETERVRVSD